MGDLERDTRVEGRDGTYRATLSEDWRIWGPNGGYLAAIALRAAGREAAIPRPASLHAQFLAVAHFGLVDVRVRPVRVGRRSESFAVAITQEERPILEALVRTAAEGEGLVHDVAVMPPVPPPDALQDIATLLERHDLKTEPGHPFWLNLETRPVEPERVVASARGPSPASPPVWREWYRFRPRDTFDDPWTDAARCVVLVDTMTWPAAVRPHLPEPGYTAPNLDVTVWFHRGAAAEPWLLADHTAEVAEGGLMGTHARIWVPDGRLVASGGAQLFCVPAPPQNTTRR